MVQSIIVDVKNNKDVTNLQLLSCIHYILSRNCLRQCAHPITGNISILAIDNDPALYHSLVPRRCVFDAYSQWYPLPLVHTTHTRENGREKSNMVHIATQATLKRDGGGDITPPLLKLLDRLLQAARENGSANGELVLVIDSLSTLARYTGVGALASLTLLRNRAASAGERVVLVTAMKREELERTVEAEGLVNAFDVHVLAAVSGSAVELEVRRRRASGRAVFEYVYAEMERGTAVQSPGMPVVRRLVNDRVETRRRRDKSSKAGMIGRDDDGEGDQDEALREIERELENGLTFRVSLSSKEREMRAKAGLPYLHRDEELADAALDLHPKELQLEQFDEGDGDIEEDDEGELFSEDV